MRIGARLSNTNLKEELEISGWSVIRPQSETSQSGS